LFFASNPSILAIPSKSFFNHQNKPYTRVAFDKCSFYKQQKGHWKAQYLKLRQQIKFESLTVSHNLILIDHLKVINHNTTILPVTLSGSITDPTTLAMQFQKFLPLQPQAMSASSSVGQLSHSSSGMSYFEWVLDSSASHYISLDSSPFTFVPPSPSILVMIADDTLMPSANIGSVVTSHMSLFNVYLIQKIRLNLAFVGQLCDSCDYLVIFLFLFLSCTRSAVSKAI
jgi:hypothetical protein